jgi:hypothetical protein
MNAFSLPHCCGGQVLYIPLKVNAVNAVKPECQNAGKNQSGIGIWTSTQQSQSCIGIPESGQVWYWWSRTGPALPSYGFFIRS